MRITSIKIGEGVLRELRTIATAERRSVGFLVRDSIELWLAKHRRQAGADEVEETGKS
jgi:hypothetical protein